MSEIEAKAHVGTETNNRIFLLRRLHSLAGLVPVGVFLVMHLSTNASILAGPGMFQENVDRIHGLGPLLIPVEVVFIFVPILFHAILGVRIWLTSEPNTARYRYGGNIRYTLQRTTGIIAFVFIMAHLWHMHWVGKPLGGGFFDPHDASSTAAAAIDRAWWWAPAYAVGVLASVFHLANGIWTSLITWGITVGPRSQRAAGYVCAVIGLFLGFVGLGALYGFKNFDESKAGGDHGAKHASVAQTITDRH